MENYFTINISKDRMSASLEPTQKVDSAFTIDPNEIEAFLSRSNVTFGIKQDSIKQLVQNPSSVKYPLLIAEGVFAINGQDAYLINELPQEGSEVKGKINFRNVLKIPSVKGGQLLASIVPPTAGSNGTDISGKTVSAKNGKPLKIRAGKNVVQNGNQFYSTFVGQISIAHNMISVNPVFEVKGNVDLRTGNIDFIGNVVIKGDVPTGYEIKAGGDIKVFGLVEGATIIAEGNIYIIGGIAGGNRAIVKAEGDIHAAYINQAHVQSGQDVEVTSSILHSQIEAGGSIFCTSGHVIGGHLTSGKDMHIKELGNHLYTKTELHLGWIPLLIKKEQELVMEHKQVSDNLSKLAQIEARIIEVAKHKGQFTEEQKSMILKQRATLNQLQTRMKKIQDDLDDIEEEKEERLASSLIIFDSVYPNTLIHFGKYSKLIQQKHTYVRFHITDGEIVFEPVR